MFFCLLFLNQIAFNMWILIDFYINQDYISKNECVNRFDKISDCHGKCILSSRFEKYRKNTSSKQIPNCKEIEIEAFLFIPMKAQSTLYLQSIKTGEIISFNSLYNYFYKTFVFHPPRRILSFVYIYYLLLT
ncbi:hypothetical protein [Aquimarina muelleri]|nr:hypothetical protein [Aquimarina muelleri]MCX2762274.1 hypothetical protein [Aquimarina muelleri]